MYLAQHIPGRVYRPKRAGSPRRLTPMQRWTLWHVAYGFVPLPRALHVPGYIVPVFRIEGKDVSGHMRKLGEMRLITWDWQQPAAITLPGIVSLLHR